MKMDEINKTFDKIILKKKISDIIQDNITVHPTITEDLEVKCSVWNRKSVITSFHNHATMFGLTMLDTDESGIAFELYDKEHDATLKFTKKFIEQNLLDYKNQGKKEINLEDIFRAYDNLPDGNKDAVNIIKFLYGNDQSKDEGVMGWSQFMSKDSFNEIGIPHYLLTSMNDTGNNFERVLAHESAHCRDYPPLTQQQKDAIKRVANNEGNTDDLLTVMDLKLTSLAGGEDKFTQTWSGFDDSQTANLTYLTKENGLSMKTAMSRNKSSDYGETLKHEDYAEASSMIITGYRNPDNPNSTVTYNGRAMQFREWITVHPYQAQYLIKELYGESVSIADIQKMGVSTPLVPNSQSISEILDGLI